MRTQTALTFTTAAAIGRTAAESDMTRDQMMAILAALGHDRDSSIASHADVARVERKGWIMRGRP